MRILIIVLWVAVSVFTVIIFPFLITVKINYDPNKGGAFFTVKLFDFIKIINAKIIRSGFGFIIKFSEKKKKKINILSFADVNGAIKPFMDFNIRSFKICVFKTGYDLISEYNKAFIFNYLLDLIIPVIKRDKPYVKAKSRIVVSEGASYVSFSISVNILLNTLVVLFTAIKSLWGKIYGK